MLNNKTIPYGFIAGAAMNIGGVLIFSRLFTNEVIPEADPVVMSNFGMLMIVVWGAAYLSVLKDYASVKWLIGVFTIEKLIYGIVWVRWHLNNDLSAVYDEDTMAGIFFTIYGASDWIFFLFFGLVFLQLHFAKDGVLPETIMATKTNQPLE